MADGKWISGLTPDTRVTDAARHVLSVRLQVVRYYLPLVVKKPYEDTEYVHQLRVATRRAGAALKVFGAFLPKKHLKSTKRALRTIRQAAGDARDWDVFILGIPEARPLQTAAGKPAQDFLLGYGLGERSAAQARLAAAITDTGATFESESTALPDRVRESDDTSRPTTFGGLAYEHLDELLSDFTAAARADPAEPAELHQFRIRGKRLRYAIELFAGCFAPPLKERVYPAVEAIQALLGETQDAAVGVRRMEELREKVKSVVAGEWKRLRTGITGLIRGMTTKLQAGRTGFQDWRKEWDQVLAEHSLKGLQLAPDAAGGSPAPTSVTVPVGPGGSSPPAAERPDHGPVQHRGRVVPR